jgi:hypothetical protein
MVRVDGRRRCLCLCACLCVYACARVPPSLSMCARKYVCVCVWAGLTGHAACGCNGQVVLSAAVCTKSGKGTLSLTHAPRRHDTHTHTGTGAHVHTNVHTHARLAGWG